MHNEQHFLIKTAFIIVYIYHSSLVITFFSAALVLFVNL